MWPYVFLLLRRQPGKSALASSGFLLAACALVLLSATTQTTVVQASQIINQNWRSTYDLVVLPPQANAPQRGTVIPADMLEGYDGGISIQQYHEIQRIPGVAVAAPIAYLGYVQLPLPSIQFTTTALPSAYYRLDWTLTAFNGQRQITELQQSLVVALFSSCDSMPPLATRKALVKKGVLFYGCGFQAESYPFQPPDTGTFLLAAIDPEAENQLVHLNQSIVQGRMLTQADSLHLDPRLNGGTLYFANQQGKPIPVYAVPMLIHQQLPGQITLRATFTQLASAVALPPQQVLAEGGSNVPDPPCRPADAVSGAGASRAKRSPTVLGSRPGLGWAPLAEGPIPGWN
jgi:hypothetical protein